MESVSHALSNWIVPGLILLIVIAFIATIRVVASRYKKIPPDFAGIFYGRSYAYKDAAGQIQHRGFKVLLSGGKVLIPFVESYKEFATSVFQINIEENAIPNKDNVKMTIRGVATCKISTAEEDLINAASNFLNKSSEQVAAIVKNIMMGHLRSIVGNSTIDELLRKRDEFNKRTVVESSEELKRLGIQIINLVIQDVKDDEGYIDALGKQAVAEAKRDAEIKVAEATRDKEIKVSDAEKEAAIVQAQNAAKVAEAEADKEIKQAQYKVHSDTERAKAENAFGIASAEQEKTLRVKQAERDAAEKEAQILVQEKEAIRMERQLGATVIKSAEAEKTRLSIVAEGEKNKRTIEAEGTANALKIEALAKRESEINIGEGEASRKKASLIADAEGEKAKLLAEADGEKAKLIAAAEGKKADAEATQKLAEALKALDEKSQLMMILDRAPHLLETGGDALAKVMKEALSAIAAPLGNIDSLNIVDVGGNGKGVDQLTNLVPGMLLKLLSVTKAMGLDFSTLLSKVGLDADATSKLIGKTSISNDQHQEKS